MKSECACNTQDSGFGIKECKHEDNCSNVKLLNFYKNVFNNIYNWFVVVDAKGHIVMMNKSYCDFFEVSQEEVIGKHVTEVIENTRMHIVVKTGQREIGDVQQIKGNQMIADRIPLFENGKIIGAVGTVIFKDLMELDVYVKKLRNMENELEFYKTELKKAMGAGHTFDSIVGTSDAVKVAKNLARKVAHTKSSVLLLGESGTGKELFAQAIHNASPRADYPLIKINCAAIPAELLESELFGYEEGAFTGAKKGGKPGKFELANKSTIFLDEIGDLPMSMQAKLLRAIQEREIERVGGVKSQKIDVRIIAATNQNLEAMIADKTFREDLYYRLNVINIKIPPLRERKEDIPVIARHLVRKLSKEMGCHVTEISDPVMDALQKYDWPGNIRELENVIERALNLVEKEATIMHDHLPLFLRKVNKFSVIEEPTTLKVMLEEVERQAIETCLQRTGGNKYQTARILDISRTSLYEKLKKYNLDC